jgi:D-3-phosphoglycerate dehydrogenase
MRPVVAVALSEFGVHDRTPLDVLERGGLDVRMNRLGRRLQPHELIALAGDADGIIAGLERYDEAILDALPRLRCISRCGVGVDNIDMDAVRRRGIAVANTPNAPTDAVAELAVAMILALLRDLVPQHLSMRQRTWRRTPTRLMKGRSVVVIGLGRIGRRTVEILEAFGAHPIGVDPMADRAWCESRGVPVLDLASALPRAEVLVMVAAKDPHHPLRIGGSDLTLMPRGAIVVNVARGGLIDEDALADALRSGHIAGAGLDVYEH